MHIKKYLITGLLVWLPLGITVYVLSWLIGLFDSVFGSLLYGAEAFLPESAHGLFERLRSIHGLGAILVALALFFTGALVSNVAGRWMVRQGDRLLHNIPIFRSIYSSVKKVSDTLFSSNGNAFRKAVLVQYPRAGSWTIGFVTGAPSGEVARHLPGEHVSIYVPTTPNPTSGFFLMVPRADVVELEMSVDQALTYVISMGSVPPSSHAQPAGPARPGPSVSNP